jgi:hypothetical protein
MQPLAGARRARNERSMNTPIYDPVRRRWVTPGAQVGADPAADWVPDSTQQATGGLVPDQGAPLPSAPDPYEAGRNDRMQADDYYSGVTGSPRVSTEPRGPVPAGRPSATPASGRVDIGARNPSARRPGSGQGVIRKGNQVFGYNDGVQVLNPDGTPREFASEEEAMNFLDSLRAQPPAAPATAAPQADASPLSNPGAVTARAQKAQAQAAPMSGHPTPVSADGKNRAMVDAGTYAQPAPAAPAPTQPGMLPAVEAVQGARGAAPLNTFEASRQTPMRPQTQALLDRAMNPTAQPPAEAAPTVRRTRVQEYPAGVPATARRVGEWWNEATKRAAWNPPPGDVPAATERRAGRYQAAAERYNPFSTSRKRFGLEVMAE